MLKIGNNGIWKILAILIVFLLAMVGATPSAWAAPESDSSSATIYVPDNYSTIQEAVDAATPGDTIIVRDGAYIENIDVNKRLTIRSENGYDSTIVQAEDPGDHVFDVTVDYVNISGFTVKGATGWLAAGIYLYYADYCNISNNICSNNDWGIYLEYSSNNSISGNDVINNDWGIYLEYSSNNSISGNDVINNNYYGSHLEYSSNNSISGNTFVNGGLFVSKSSYHNTIEGNTVNNKPLVYLEDASDYKIEDAGQVILINCRNITVENLDLSNTYVGIELWVTVDSIIADNTVSNNWRGIYLGDSSNNSISGNNVSDNNVNGIYLRYSNNNTISGNDVNNNDDGISLYDSSNNTISGNDVNSNDDGIYLDDSSNNSISGNNVNNNDDGIYLDDSSNNTISGNDIINNNYYGISLYDSSNNSISGNDIINNNYYGISLYDSSNNSISGNTFVNDGLFVSKSSYHNTVEGNTVNNKPLVYLEGASDYKVKDAGQVILVNCRNITVENLDLSNTCVGIELWVTVDSIIADNTVSNNRRGISLYDSSNNSISGNNVSDNNVNGIYLRYSSNNTISGNDVNNNDDGIYLDDSSNNTISGNNVSSNNWDGIYLDDSSNNTISGNDVNNNDDGIYLDDSSNNTISGNDVNNNDDGIYLDDSSNNTISGNTFVNDGLFVSKSSYHNTVEGNTVNNKPLVYLEGASDYKVKDAGQIILVNCRNITVENLDLSNTRVGIEVAFSSFITIKNNNCSNNKYDGIYLPYSNSNNISNNNCSNNQYGIHIYESNNNHISNNNCSDNKDGIYLRHSNNNSISNNNCSSNKWRYIFGGGIHLYESNSNNISGNSCSFNNWDGIKLDDSNNNHLSNNHCSNNKDGIALEDSTNNKLNGNIMLENGIVIWGDSLSDYTQEIDESNTANEKSVYYRKDIDGGRIPDGAGQVILVNCTNISIENQNLNNASVGIEVAFSSFITIKNNNCSNNKYGGIYLPYSNSNNISNSNCSNNQYGIHLYESNNNHISNNNCSDNKDGIYLRHSNNNSITNNNCSSNKWWWLWGYRGDGILLYESNSNNISNNSCSFNNWDGIKLDDSNNNKLNGNIMLENGIVIWGDSLSDYTHEIDESNTVNGKPVYYWKGVKGVRIPDGAGQVILVNCTNISIENQNLNNASIGIQIAFSSYITIKNNNCSNSKDDSIYLYRSKNNSISNNNCSNSGDGIRFYESNNNCMSNNNCSNNGDGIRLYESNNNLIHPNNFINNTDNVYSYGSTNLWNSKEKISYTYNETTYTNYLGNYWSDYNGTDTDKDGIGDIPYSINTDKDNYPLMQPWQDYFPEENEAKENKNQKLAFSTYYQPINISVNHSVPPYQLPLNLSNITNIEDITAKLGLNETAEELLETNGFVILDYGQEDDIVAPYKDMKDRGIPIFVTTDTLLHLYHIQFNEILKGIEEREFFDALVDMSNAMLNQSVKDYDNFDDLELKESARRNVAYFAVALKLLQTPTEGYNGTEDIKVINFSIPEYVIEDVNKELENITQHDGFHPSAIFNSNPNCICDYPCCYCEDYSQYVPRGHYTRSEQLKRYFKAMMWYGRIAFMLKGCNGDDALISGRDANLSTIQAVLISSELPDVTVNNSTAQEIWDRIYSVTAFFVGTADDLTPYEYRDAQNIVFGTAYNVSDLSNEDKLLKLKVELAKLRSPEIYGGSGVCVVYPPITEAKLYVCLNKTKGMRFMGQRFVPDSYMFQQLVSPAVGMYTGNGTPFTMCYTQAGPARCFPRGLDIMSVLGSERAGDILIEEGDTEYEGLNLNTSYEKQLNELQSKFTAFNTSDWNRNLYWSWLYTLKPLLTEFGDGYPTFMQTRAWQEKELQTSLASWTELRHDTILYGKQSYTPVLKGMPPKPKLVVGYVEPVPEFYSRLLALTTMTEKGLVDLDVLNETEKARLHNLGLILERLMNLSVAELENETLTEVDYKFIMDFGANLDSLVAGVNDKGKETTIVADVHTDCNTKRVLEEGVGYVDLILVAYIVPDGRIIVGAGPVFSYYEFTQPMDNRLTDDKWKEMLKEDPPKKPGWVDGIGG